MKPILPSVRADPSWAAFLAFAFLAGFSMPFARVAMLLSLVFSLADPKRRRCFRLTGPAVGWLVYFAVAVAVSAAAWAVLDDPFLDNARGFRKLSKLLWFAAIPLGVMQVDSRARLQATLRAFVLGCAVTALVVIALHPVLAWFQLSFPNAGVAARQALLDEMAAAAPGAAPAEPVVTPFWMWVRGALGRAGALAAVERWIETPWRPATYAQAVFKLGSMADAQRLMAAAPAALCLFLESLRGSDARRKAVSLVLFLLVFAGLLLTFKRGAALAAAVVCFGLLLSRLRWWKALAVAAAVVGLAALSPRVRGRFADLPGEFSVEKGGRALMWSRLVPELHAEHPWGVGFRALTYAKLHQVERTVSLRREAAFYDAMAADLEKGLPAVRASGDRKSLFVAKRRLDRARARASNARFHLANPPRDQEALEREIAVGARGAEDGLPPMTAPIYLELNQRHVHSVPLQSFVDFGWAGVLAWAFWMVLGLRGTGALALRSRRPEPGSTLRETICFAAPFAMFAALFLYGFVEYNVADGEIVLVYALALGLSGPSLLRSE